MADRFTGKHVLTIAREHDKGKVKFGWSLCIPGRWEQRCKNELVEKWYDTSLGEFIPKEEYEALVQVAARPTIVETEKKENDGELVVVDFSKDELQEIAVERLSGIQIFKERQRQIHYTLVRGDNFCKRTGRQNAIDRLLKSPITVEVPEGMFATEAIMGYLRKCKDVPPQVVEIACVEHAVYREERLAKTKKEQQSPEPVSVLNRPTETNVPWRNLWNTEMGKVTLVIGAVCVGYLFSLALAAVVP